jgi:hypothetical protein
VTQLLGQIGQEHQADFCTQNNTWVMQVNCSLKGLLLFQEKPCPNKNEEGLSGFCKEGRCVYE